MPDNVIETSAPSVQAGAQSRLKIAEAIVGMVKTLTVPIILLVFAISFYSPLSEIIALLPGKFRDADKVSAGATGLSFEIQRRAAAEGNPRLARLIGGLSEPSIRYLLSSSQNRSGIVSYSSVSGGDRGYYYPDEGRISVLKELEAKKLLACDTSISEWQLVFNNMMEIVPDKFQRNLYRPRDKFRRKVENGGAVTNYCGLTTTGTSAVNLIIESVTQQISRST